MPFETLRIIPSVDVEETLADNAQGISESNYIRWRDKLPERRGGSVLFNNEIVQYEGGIVDIHPWQGLNAVKQMGVATETNLYVYTQGPPKNITPRYENTNVAVSFDTSTGSSIVTVLDPDFEPTKYDTVVFNTPVSVGGLILNGAYGVVDYLGSNQYTIDAGINSIGAPVTNGGVVPFFSTTSGSNEITVFFPDIVFNPSLPYPNTVGLGDVVYFKVPTDVGGITIYGNYVILSVNTSTYDSFTINASNSASSTATAFMNAGNASFTYWVTLGPTIVGSGYGVYAYGGPSVAPDFVETAYGTGSATAGAVNPGTKLVAQDYYLDNWGEVLIATPEIVSVVSVSSTPAVANQICSAQTPNAGQMVINGVGATYSLDNVAAAQDPSGAGNLVLQSTVVNFAEPSHVYVTSAIDDTAFTFTITGTDINNAPQVEVIPGANAKASVTSNKFNSVTSVSVDGNCGSVTVGSFSKAVFVNDTSRQVTITPAGNESSNLFTITGTDVNGNIVTETVAGKNAAISTSIRYFYTVTSIVIANNAANTITIGMPNIAAFYGLNLTGGPIFTWSPLTGDYNASIITTAPLSNLGAFVAMPQQQIMAWGSTYSGESDPLQIRWSDVGDYTVWTPTAVNQAGGYHIPTGSRIQRGFQGPTQQYWWTDLDLYVSQYIGAPAVYGFNKIGSGCGLIASKAVAQLNSTIYWMSQKQFFMVSSSNAVQPIPCSVWDFIFQNMDWANVDNVEAAANSQFNEVTWFFPSLTGDNSYQGENNAYVCYNVLYNEWDFGYMNRVAWCDQSVWGSPIAAASDGYLYQHDVPGIYSDNNVPQNSGFKTGYFSLTNGNDLVFVDWMLPDMKWGEYSKSQNAKLLVSFNVTDYAGQTPTLYGPFEITQDTEYIEPRFRGRFVQIIIETQTDDSPINAFWRLGSFRYRYSISGRR